MIEFYDNYLFPDLSLSCQFNSLELCCMQEDLNKLIYKFVNIINLLLVYVSLLMR